MKFKVESRLGEKRWMQDWVRGRGGILPASGQVSVHAASAASEPGIGPVKLAASVFPVEWTMSFTSTWYLHHMASSKKVTKQTPCLSLKRVLHYRVAHSVVNGASTKK